MVAASYAPDAIEAGSYKRDRKRYLRIIYFFTYQFLEILLWEFGLYSIFGKEFVKRGRETRGIRTARRFRELAVDMGGVMIKLGQFFSTRVDVLPESVVRVLEDLQDEVKPVPFDQIQGVLTYELVEKLAEFSVIDALPKASASLGQVHRAKLYGEKVVLKVQRPGIRAMVQTDLDALGVVSNWAMKWAFIRRRADVPALLDEFSRVLWEELDYQAEATNAERFQRMFADDTGVYVPKVYREFSTRRVLVLEDVGFIKINDYAALVAAGINRTEVARRLLDTYLTQIFVEHFFHADPHPGNIFIEPLPYEYEVKTNGHNPKKRAGRPFRLIFVDYGMVGRLTPELVDTLRRTMIAGGLRDARALIEAYDRLGLFMPETDKERLIVMAQRAFDLVWGLNMTQMGDIPREEMTRFGKEFSDLIYTVPFRMPQNLIYLGRCVGILSGMCTGLDAHFDPWKEVQPYVRILLEGDPARHKEEVKKPRVWESWNDFFKPENLRAFLSEDNLDLALSTSADYFARAVQVPIRADEVLRKADRGELQTRIKLDTELTERLDRLESQSRRNRRTMLLSALIVAGAIVWHGNRN